MKHFQKIDILGKIKGKDRSFYNINVPCASRRSKLYRYSLTRKKKKKKNVIHEINKKINTIKKRSEMSWGKKNRKEKKEVVRKKETKENRERRMKIKIDS